MSAFITEVHIFECFKGDLENRSTPLLTNYDTPNRLTQFNQQTLQTDQTEYIKMNSHEIAILIICFKTDPNKQNEKIQQQK